MVTLAPKVEAKYNAVPRCLRAEVLFDHLED